MAALAVAVGHSLIWLPIGPENGLWAKTIYAVHGTQANIARLLLTFLNGAAAVDIFFVLSGFVLCRSLADQRLTISTYAGFVIKRLFRIIPAFWLSLAVVCLYLTSIYPGYAVLPGAAPWYNGWYGAPLTISQVIDNATMRSVSLNPNAWTLTVELIASFALPLFVGAISAGGSVGSAMVLALTFLLAWEFRDLAFAVSTQHYMYMFVLGAIVGLRGRNSVVQRFDFVMLPAALVAMLLANALFTLTHPIFADVLVSIGAAMLVWCIDGGSQHPMLAILDSRLNRFLGRISYSFYLLHFVILYAMANLILRNFPRPWLVNWPLPTMLGTCIASVAFAGPLSALAFAYIEKPSTLMGRRIAQGHWGAARAQ